MASDEAVKAANGIAQMYHPALPDDLVAVAATMIDDHTAALRAEVEALRARVADTEWRESSKVEPDEGVIVEGWDGQDTYIHLYQRAAINYCQCEGVCVCDSPNPVVEWCLYEDAELAEIYKHQVDWTAWEYWESGIIAPEYWRPYTPPAVPKMHNPR